MAFTRNFLMNHGVPEDQVDAIMAERNRTLTDYVPKSDVQAQIDAAVEEAKRNIHEPVKVEDSDEYKAVVAERDMLRAIGGEEFASIKPKFRETVYGMLDRGEEAAGLADQLAKVKEQFEEYFIPPESQKSTPVFSKPAGSTHTNETEEDRLYAELVKHWDKK